MFKNQRGQTLVEFAIAIVILFLFVFGLMGATLWGTASFLAQEIAHETAREYAVSNDKARAISTGKTYIGRWGYIFIAPGSTQISVNEAGDKATAVITVKPRIQKLFIFTMPSISKYSQATFEHYIRNPDLYVAN
jgi:Flp pilus assembly protein TadG